jgi:threonine dehydrogenase-like Zn-dependent dehydrogenase
MLVVKAAGILALMDQVVNDPGDGEVKLQTLISGVSHGTEMRRWKNNAQELAWDTKLRITRGEVTRSYPIALGYDNIGKVIAVGSRVELPIGSIVWTNQPHQRWNVISEQQARCGLLFTPQEAQGITLRDLEPYTFTIRSGVALNAVHDAGIVLGSRVAVIGAGAIGLLVAQMALLNGAAEVYCVDRYPQRLALAQALGANPIPCQEDDADAAYSIKQRCGGVDVSIETSGTYAGLQTAIRACRMCGSIITVSTYNGPAASLCLSDEWSKNRLSIHSSMSINGCPSRLSPLWDLARVSATARQFLANGQVKTRPLITHRFPFERAIEAFRMIETIPSEVIQVIFTYEQKGDKTHVTARTIADQR